MFGARKKGQRPPAAPPGTLSFSLSLSLSLSLTHSLTFFLFKESGLLFLQRQGFPTRLVIT